MNKLGGLVVTLALGACAAQGPVPAPVGPAVTPESTGVAVLTTAAALATCAPASLPSATPSSAADVGPGEAPPPAVRPSPIQVLPTMAAKPNWQFLALGDSHTRFTFLDPGLVSPGWLSIWIGAYHQDPPVVVSSGVNGDFASGGLARLDNLLAANALIKYVGIGYGTNEAFFEIPLETYRENLRKIVLKVRAKGLVPMMSTVPDGNNPRLDDVADFNKACLEVRTQLNVAPGPDLNTLCQEHPEFKGADGVHLTPTGYVMVGSLWADAVIKLANADGLR